ncbi:cobalamin biosynthesis protein CobW [Neorhizobium galegae]|uniref:cobalamin biosynthesis protein CobW n=1 Tax=Neorhizobium galegae TaxID=399 RepID=UPI000621555F|nr:cobalamin biosynthesis protein CobW [Neorhizobium galegae]CDZ62767.1 Cobalamin biosynthesis protein CobW [Neorhizobium galegae bv. orientalis]KAB1120795.1 cobalamin biosynthesis protein CobW [Neorhizobium galegae]MCQ1574002.1 cobalamin biosynthesis protein CobW [Neorhizobium galegae]MCQ1809999.1 cobalamin biosynthesis protein CobW [Neorhizobium galegae]UIK05341.1 cobalamin biosynthesis protein CobW [Neorhizobium galegae]
MSVSFDRVPCTVVTGFLGAGKTTLIRNLIENLKGKRLAIIVNEFGDVGIDGDVLKGCGIESCPEDNIIELANGCICCTVADDFVPAIDRILAIEPRVDHILIETSGLALPKPLVQAFQWPDVKARVTVDAVIAVVDGLALAEGRVADDHEALEAQRQADGSIDHDDPVEEVFEDQVACADMIVLTKSDLLDAAGLATARDRVAAHLPRAVKIVSAANGAIDPAVLIGLGLAVEDDIENRKTHHDDELDHDHDDFDSFVVDLAAVTDAEQLAARISATAEAENVLRIKGFVEVANKPMRLQVQAVGSRVNHYFDRAWAPGEARTSRLVVIGEKGIDRAAIERMLAA